MNYIVIILQRLNYCYSTEPWFVLLALQEAQAVNEDAAMSSNVLLKRMLKIGVRRMLFNYKNRLENANCPI